MRYINNITADSFQQLTLTGIPSVQINMALIYMPRIQGWVMNLNYNTFSANGIAVVNSLNLLRQFKNIIPFGISCIRADGLDPYLQTDFAAQLANLYLLDSDDVANIETEWFA